MSIQSTIHISREYAIERISLIHSLKQDYNYKEIQDITVEDASVESFVDGEDIPSRKMDVIEQWTNKMLEDKMDEPFYRRSLFENYLID